MLKHFAIVLKKKAAKQKDVEYLFSSAIINFSASEAEFHMVRF